MGVRDDTRRSYPETRGGIRVHISRRPSRDEKWEVGDRDLGRRGVRVDTSSNEIRLKRIPVYGEVTEEGSSVV